MSTNKTTDKDLGETKFINEAKNAKGSVVEVGIFDDAEAYEDLVTVAEVGFWNEFGTVTIPERSFIRSTMDENRKKLEILTAKLFGDIVSGKIDTKKALNILGVRIREMIRKKVLDLNDPVNAPYTVATKGFNNPLVDSRRLWRSIAHEVKIKEA